MKNYYDKTYYDWQKQWGELGALIDLWKYQPYIKDTDTVLDFGCGGGYILEKLRCKERYGVDVNTIALEEAQKRGIRVYETLDQLPKGIQFNVIISHHTLEHVEDPAKILKDLRKFLKPNGVSIHVLPINDWRNDRKYNPNNISKHLYGWTPLLLGNLFAHCGYEIQKVEMLTHAYLPFSTHLYPIMPKALYHATCTVWSFLTLNRQLRIVATLSSSFHTEDVE